MRVLQLLVLWRRCATAVLLLPWMLKLPTHAGWGWSAPSHTCVCSNRLFSLAESRQRRPLLAELLLVLVLLLPLLHRHPHLNLRSL
jgi:hypothetical protein